MNLTWNLWRSVSGAGACPALGRDAAGVHYRSDGVEGIKLGEAMAISILRDTVTLYNEVFPGFSFTKYDATPVTISPTY
jgi:hypothetical protein